MLTYLPSLLAPKASEASKGAFYWWPAVRSGSCNWVCYRGSSEMCQIHTQWSHFSEVNLCIFTMCIFAKCTRLTHLLSFASLGEKVFHVHDWPHSVIHHRIALHRRNPKIWWDVTFRHPMKRQNSGDASGQTCNPYPILRLIYEYEGRDEGTEHETGNM